MLEIFFPSAKKPLILDVENVKLWFDNTWCLAGKYFCRKSGYKTSYLHKEVMGVGMEVMVDHIDRNTFNNSILNLRFSNKVLNAANQSKTKLRCSSKYKGVCWHKKAGKYSAAVKAFGKLYYLGLHSTQEEAAKAYNKKATEMFGSHAALNPV